jgi:hypothetical protein
LISKTASLLLNRGPGPPAFVGDTAVYAPLQAPSMSVSALAARATVMASPAAQAVKTRVIG